VISRRRFLQTRPTPPLDTPITSARPVLHLRVLGVDSWTYQLNLPDAEVRGHPKCGTEISRLGGFDEDQRSNTHGGYTS
jgi:hypothetical protein